MSIHVQHTYDFIGKLYRKLSSVSLPGVSLMFYDRRLTEQKLALLSKGRDGYRGMWEKAHAGRLEVKTPKLYLGKSGSDRLRNCAGMLSASKGTTELWCLSLASQEQSPGTAVETTCFRH